MGKGNHFYQFASIGEACQDKKYKGEPTELVIGDYNVFREGCSVHRGTVQDKGQTIIGSHNLFMNTTHVAHDCVIGSHVIFASGAQAAGHVHIGDWAILGGMSGIHQFCHIGAHAFIGGGSIVVKDVPPCLMAHGAHAVPAGLNVEGLKRRGFTAEQISVIKRAYRTLYRSSTPLESAILSMLAQEDPTDVLQPLIAFLQSATRGIVR